MSSSFRADVGDVLANPGSRREITVTGTLEAARDLATVEEPVAAEVLLESTPSGIVATGVVTAQVALICSRCLVPWADEVRERFTHVFSLDPTPDTFPIDGSIIDLEPALRDEVLSAVPVNAIHAPDCRGLCGTCGMNLNDGVCDCDETELSSPFAELKDLFDGP